MWWQEGQSGVGSPLSPGLEVGLRLSSSLQHTPQVTRCPDAGPRIAVYAHKLSLSPPVILSSTGQHGLCRELQEPMGHRATRGKVPGSPRDRMGHTASSCFEFHPHEEHKSLALTPSPSPLARHSVSVAGVMSVVLRGTGKDQIWGWEDKGVGKKEKIIESESMPEGEKARAENKTGAGNRDQGRLFLSTNAPQRPKWPFCNGRCRLG